MVFGKADIGIDHWPEPQSTDDAVILRLIFHKTNIHRPLMAALAKQGIAFNLLSGNIEQVIHLGQLIISVQAADLKHCQAYFNAHHIQNEIIAYADSSHF